MGSPARMNESASTLAEAGAEVLTGERRTAVASIVAASLLMTLKLVAGVLTGSLGLVSAGIESSGDVVAATVTLFAVRLDNWIDCPSGLTCRRGRSPHIVRVRKEPVLLAGR